MARVPQELTQRRIKGLNKIRNDLRIQFKEITELGIYIEQPMMEIHKNLDEILIRLGYVQKEPYSGLERRKNIQTMDGKRCRII